jgi:hypothetical protein
MAIRHSEAGVPANIQFHMMLSILCAFGDARPFMSTKFSRSSFFDLRVLGPALPI